MSPLNLRTALEGKQDGKPRSPQEKPPQTGVKFTPIDAYNALEQLGGGGATFCAGVPQISPTPPLVPL